MSTRESLLDDVNRQGLPLLVIDLDDYRITAVSTTAMERIGTAFTSLIGRDVRDFVAVGDRPNTELALDSMKRGDIDFFRAQRHPGPEVLDRDPVIVWVRSFTTGDERIALILLSTVPLTGDPMAKYMGRVVVETAIGTVDSGGFVTWVSNDIASLLDVTPQEFVGRRLLDPSKDEMLSKFFDAVHGSGAECSVAIRCEQENGGGTPQPLICFLASLFGAPSRGFVLFPEFDVASAEVGEHSSELENHLWRIAREVQASGILERIEGPSGATWLPELAELSARQWEILVRLRQGKRVPTIAQELFISQSTVRNALSAIFKRFGVHSQAELLETIAKRTAPSG